MLHVRLIDGEIVQFEDCYDAAPCYDACEIEQAIEINLDAGTAQDRTAALLSEIRAYERDVVIEREHIRAESHASLFI